MFIFIVLVLLLSANDSVLSDPAEEPHTYVPQEVETKSDRERLEMGLMYVVTQSHLNSISVSLGEHS